VCKIYKLINSLRVHNQSVDLIVICNRVLLTATKTGTKIAKATNQRTKITSRVLLRLNIRRNVMGLLIARYLSMLITVMVNTEAATATPVNMADYLVRELRSLTSHFLNRSRPRFFIQFCKRTSKIL